MDASLDWCAPADCSLPLADQPARVVEWDTLFAEAVREVSGGPGRVRFSLDAGRTSPAMVADLAGREAQCCPFLMFTLTVGGTALTLEVSTEPGHSDVVAALAARATARAARR